MEFTIKEYDVYKQQEVLSLYESVGWTSYTENPDMLRLAFAGSLKVLGAWVDDILVGVIRVVGDGASIVYIQDILIRPECQRKGIGTALMKQILDTYSGVYQKCLSTDNTEKTVAFYRSLGFYKLDDWDCCGFMKNF